MRFLYILTIASLIGCTSNNNIEIIKTNLTKDNKYLFDYKDAFQYGFTAPSTTQDGISHFSVTFKIPEELTNETVYYKIYYQNESYKFSEIDENGNYNMLSEENFYGSWANTNIGFIPSDEKKSISTEFLIHGNPRNEEVYINQNSRRRKIRKEDIDQLTSNIKNNKDWFQKIQDKAKSAGIETDKQIELDANWLLSQKINNRWQRNPRVGKYNLLIVAGNKSAIDKIPDYIQNINLKKGDHFINPFYFFKHGDGQNIKGLKIFEKNDFVQLKASVPLKNGFYIPHSDNFLSKDYYNDYLNESEEQYSQASFTYHDTYRTDSIYNLPIKTDFFKDGFSIEEYKDNQTKYDSTDRVATWLASAQYPGKNFGYNENDDYVWFQNPATPENELRKEHVGFKTRHGLTYGKYTFKIKMAELLNQEQVWTGLTNAIWMLCDTQGPWNNRRTCDGDGYYPYYVTKESKKLPQRPYSEIDFEILKAAEFWPKWDYKDPENERVEPESHKDKIMVACTNWDMSCSTPENYDVGVHQIGYEGKTFDLHRWHSYQNAVTSKVPELDDELFGQDYYYFQLEWNPTEIIWRIGPEKDNLHLVGYMNDKVTSIPNNQMVTVFTQEYHYSHWWPNAPFLQEDIPFPAENLPGKLFSIEIE